MAALILLLLAALRVFPSLDMILNYLASLLIALMVIDFSYRQALLVYLATAILSFFWPGLPLNILFVVFCGIYPMLKLWIESKAVQQRRFDLKILCLKLLSMLTLFTVYALLYVNLFMPIELLSRLMNLTGIKLWIVPVVILTLVVYDFLLSQGIDFYSKTLQRYLKKDQT